MLAYQERMSFENYGKMTRRAKPARILQAWLCLILLKLLKTKAWFPSLSQRGQLEEDTSGFCGIY